MATTGKEVVQAEKTTEGAKVQVNVGKAERWASMIGGAALTVYGLTRKSMAAKGVSLAGIYLLYRGQTGYDPLYRVAGVDTSKAARSVSVERSIIINRNPDEVYRFWHNFENLPRFMEHLESVKILTDRKSHWMATTPGGISYEWDAEMTEDIPNERISWRSLPEAEVQNQGTVEFKRAGAGSTFLTFTANYAIPAFPRGISTKLLQYISDKQLQKELDQFKNMIESGQILRAA